MTRMMTQELDVKMPNHRIDDNGIGNCAFLLLILSRVYFVVYHCHSFTAVIDPTLFID